MPVPLKPHLYPVVLHDEDAVPISSSNPLPVTPGGEGGTLAVKGVPGETITTEDDVAVDIDATEPLAVPPAGTRRMTVQNTGPAGTWVRVREVGATAGSGRLLPRLGEATYGGADGAIGALEVEDVSTAVGGVGVATTISVQFEGD